MKEIKILIQQLRNYPNNLFAYNRTMEKELKDGLVVFRPGLVVCDIDGNQQGFIEVGGEEGVIIN